PARGTRASPVRVPGACARRIKSYVDSCGNDTPSLDTQGIREHRHPMNRDEITAVNGGRPVVFRNATVLTMDEPGILESRDVLATGDTIAAIGPSLSVPDGTVEIDATGGILMPGMVDTHRHMWQTALRGLGADWTLTQYFVFYYLSWGKIFRPEDIAA